MLLIAVDTADILSAPQVRPREFAAAVTGLLLSLIPFFVTNVLVGGTQLNRHAALPTTTAGHIHLKMGKPLLVLAHLLLPERPAVEIPVQRHRVPREATETDPSAHFSQL